MNLLGSTLEEIAFEKAGIIKEKTPVVIGEFTNETKKVFDLQAQKITHLFIMLQLLMEFHCLLLI